MGYEGWLKDIERSWTAPLEENTQVEAVDGEPELPDTQAQIPPEKRRLFSDYFRKLSKVLPSLKALGLLAQLEAGVMSHDTHRTPEDEAELQHLDSIEHVQLDYLSTIYGGAYHIPEDYEVIDASTVAEPAKTELAEISGFQEIEIDSLDARKIFFDSYPKHWIDDEIESVRFEPGVVESLPPHYGITGTVAGSASRGGRSTIRHLQRDHGMILKTHGHEVGHVVDWETHHLSKPERTTLLYSLTKRFLTQDNLYPSSYVEGIKNKNPQKELYTKITEYWAELCEAYFTDPNFHETHPEDFALVDDWMKKTDPEFDRLKAMKEQQQALNTMYERQSFECVPPPLREKLAQMREEMVTKNKAFDIRPDDLATLKKFSAENNLDPNQVIGETYRWIIVQLEREDK